jgi:YD repeat-containing protein
VGNLASRQDLNQGLTEGFGYDDLHRLTSTQRNSDTPVTMTYNSIGNLTAKSDVGSYTYPSSGTGSVRPHAVSSAGGLGYSYDANGNMVSRNGASVTWSTFNYPTVINQTGGNSSTLYYGPERQLYRQVSLDGATTENRLTVGASG